MNTTQISNINPGPEITRAGSHTPKACILGATFTTDNMGVSMLAAGAIRCVLHRFPDAEIALLDYGPPRGDFHFSHEDRVSLIRLISIQFSKRLYLSNHIGVLVLIALASRLIPFKALSNTLLRRNQYIRKLLETDVFFAVSGGDSFSDIYGSIRFFYIALPQLLILLLQKRLILLPQTIGPFRRQSVRSIAKHILTKADIVYSRDHSGVDTVRTLIGRTDKLAFCHDMAFDVDPVAPTHIDIDGFEDIDAMNRPLVGFNISGLLLAGGYTGNNMFALKDDYQSLVHHMISELIQKQDANVLLIPHVYGSRDSLESDITACEAVYERLRTNYSGRIGIVRGTYAYNEVKHVIGQCDFFVGARMHSCIGALSQHIPTVSIAYSDKFAGVMEAIGCKDLVVDPRSMSIDQIRSSLSDIYEKRQIVRSRLQRTIPQVKRALRTLLANVTV